MRIKTCLLAALLLANAVVYYDLAKPLPPAVPYRDMSNHIVSGNVCFSNLISTMCWLWGLVYIVQGLWRVCRALRQMRLFSAPPAARRQGAAFLATGAYLFFLPALMFEYTGDSFIDAAAFTLQVLAPLLFAGLSYKIAAACRGPVPVAALKGFLYPLLRGLGKAAILLLLPVLVIPAVFYFLR